MKAGIILVSAGMASVAAPGPGGYDTIGEMKREEAAFAEEN